MSQHMQCRDRLFSAHVQAMCEHFCYVNPKFPPHGCNRCATHVSSRSCGAVRLAFGDMMKDPVAQIFLFSEACKMKWAGNILAE